MSKSLSNYFKNTSPPPCKEIPQPVTEDVHNENFNKMLNSKNDDDVKLLAKMNASASHKDVDKIVNIINCILLY